MDAGLCFRYPWFAVSRCIIWTVVKFLNHVESHVRWEPNRLPVRCWVVCTTFSAGLQTACVVNIGDRCTSIACVDDGVSLRNSRLQLSYGGHDVAATFLWLVQGIHFPYRDVDLASRAADQELVRELVHRLCHLNTDDYGIVQHEFFRRATRTEDQERLAGTGVTMGSSTRTPTATAMAPTDPTPTATDASDADVTIESTASRSTTGCMTTIDPTPTLAASSADTIPTRTPVGAGSTSSTSSASDASTDGGSSAADSLVSAPTSADVAIAIVSTSGVNADGSANPAESVSLTPANTADSDSGKDAPATDTSHTDTSTSTTTPNDAPNPINQATNRDASNTGSSASHEYVAHSPVSQERSSEAVDSTAPNTVNGVSDENENAMEVDAPVQSSDSHTNSACVSGAGASIAVSNTSIGETGASTSSAGTATLPANARPAHVQDSQISNSSTAIITGDTGSLGSAEDGGTTQRVSNTTCFNVESNATVVSGGSTEINTAVGKVVVESNVARYTQDNCGRFRYEMKLSDHGIKALMVSSSDDSWFKSF